MYIKYTHFIKDVYKLNTPLLKIRAVRALMAYPGIGSAIPLTTVRQCPADCVANFEYRKSLTGIAVAKSGKAEYINFQDGWRSSAGNGKRKKNKRRSSWQIRNRAQK
jgi:hypothetical protein